MYTIYIITNHVNGKLYVGQTTKTIEHRWKIHVYNATYGFDYLFYKAIRKHGKDSFSIQEFCTVSTAEIANELERALIFLLRTHEVEQGYNSTLGGTGTHASESLKHKMKRAALQREAEKRKNRPKNLIPVVKTPKILEHKPRPYKVNLPMSEEEIVSKYEAGQSITSLAKELNTSDLTIRRRITKSGGKVRSNGEISKQKRSVINEQQFRDLYEVKGLSARAVGRELGYDSKVISARLVDLGVEIRKNWKRTNAERKKTGNGIRQTIKDRFLNGDSRKSLAKEYDLNYTTVFRICSGELSC